MELKIDQIPQIKQFEALYSELAEYLPETLFNKLVDAQIAVRERLKLEMELRQFITDKLINQAVNQ